MDLPPRPSSSPESSELDGARGAFREALAALRNITTLVRSKKVGPKAILDVVPDVRASCEPLARSLAVQLAALEQRVPSSAAAELEGFLSQRVAALDATLHAAESGTMSARERLRLEQSLCELLHDLGASRGLLGLLASAASDHEIAVNPAELMLQRYSGPPSGGHVHALITTYLSSSGQPILSPRARPIATLLACAVEFVADDREGTPQVALHGGGRDWSAVVSLCDAPRGEQMTIWGYGLVPPTFACLNAAAECVGGELTWESGVPRLSLAGKI